MVISTGVYAQRFPVPPWRYRLAKAAERRVSDFNMQNLANIEWAFVTASQSDEQLCILLARRRKHP